ncbi:hypothetical protein [Jiella sonneratiae]|uniref:PepSY domain-containing protein n=1 Tax=Jiella sonneratiae TaxID=2816856 RepID=A0ABS3J1B7_9HYPH|nr:hypothetical protein [Jiella sonneratiae]MBO0903479.1 hypothetical protein [Jiella sonneratiae]
MALTCFAGAATAEEAETVEQMASPEEVAKVGETLALIGCTAPAVEKESERLFEVDDATCAIGQYDIKLNGDYKIIVMSIDE